MGKRTRYNCAYLTVEIDRPYRYGRELTRDHWYAAAKAARDEIVRHCDSVGAIDIESDTDELCGFCGSQWTEGDSPHNGGCCTQDIAVLEQAEAAAKAPEQASRRG